MRLRVVDSLLTSNLEPRTSNLEPRTSNWAAPARPDRFYYFDSRGLSLADLFREAAGEVDAVAVNGRFVSDWADYVPEGRDKVDVFVRPGLFGLEAILIPLLISLALSALSMLLMPKPKKPKSGGHQPAQAVSGVTNTLTPGMPKLMVFGKRRIFPGIIGSQAAVVENGRRMSFRLLYFCGVGPVSSLGEWQLEEVPLQDIPDAAVEVRLGTEEQTVIPGWEHCHQLYPDARTIAIGDKKERQPGRPIFYRTRSRAVDKLTFFVNFSSGIFGIRQKGSRAGTMHDGYYRLSIRARPVGEPGEFEHISASIDGGPLEQSPFFISGRTQDGLVKAIEYEVPARGVYDIEFQLLEIRWDSQQSSDPQLVNIQETLYLTTAYPGSAVGSIGGVGSEQITSLESLKTSAVVCGIPVETPEPVGITPSAAVMNCGGEEEIEFSAVGDFLFAPLEWTTTGGELTVAPDGRSAVLKPKPNAGGTGAAAVVYGSRRVANALQSCCDSATCRNAAFLSFDCNHQPFQRWTAVGQASPGLMGSFCNEFEAIAQNDDFVITATYPADDLSKHWKNLLSNSGMCALYDDPDDDCLGGVMGHIWQKFDARTPGMIAAGCEPCQAQFIEPVIVTVTDARGNFASAVVTS